MRSASKYLILSLVLAFVSMVGAYFVQTSGNDVEVKDLRFETPSGHLLSALLFKPKGVSEEDKAPGIVTSHGWYNNREMQDLNNVELARRGYVVISIDMYGHGNSDPVEPSEWQKRGTGMYDAVELLADLPYVDHERIGVTGHSNGARAANWSVLEDNKKPEEERLISSVLLVANDAMYTNDPGEPLYWSMRNGDQEYANMYGTRDVGIVAAKYDEFFFRSLTENGTVTPPRDYIDTDYAQSFLHFGVDPSEIKEDRESYKIYKEGVNGEEAMRVIYNPNQIHPWNHFSSSVVTSLLDYFDESIGAPESIDSSNQIWQWKVLFNFLGLVAFFIFVVSFTKVLLNTSTFSSLKATESAVASAAPRGVGKAWFWGGLLVSAIVSGWSYLALFTWSATNRPDFFPQAPVYYIGVWSAVMGVVTIVILFLSYMFFSKKEGLDLRATGVWISLRSLWKTILLALLVTVSAFGLVFVADYFFTTDFRIWVLTIKAFTPDKLLIALKYLPFFLLFYVANSISVNCFNYVATGKKEWINTALMALFNGLSAIVIVAIQYTHFFIEGDVFFTNISNIAGIWLFPIIVVIPLAAIITRKLYRVTKNPYLGGIIYAIIVTVMMVSNTLTQL
ncbi:MULTISPECIES: alpha/beta hydrolase family protein [Pontibacillus]|uniref:Acetylxylan esterase n=1 Tax=Pontibacillus chungwhensis TaxID=265426 RepID=A0ABY8USD7_9BACI|nr:MULTISPECIES: CocE/NonD family hydrolase [Pontibacillus]MCD5323200.1 acetylxylan esterase [Pontibacillus sp. HN14]WIF96587.1 acetylxylan esterase [Pontibacillus chungwhensis]